MELYTGTSFVDTVTEKNIKGKKEKEKIKSKLINRPPKNTHKKPNKKTKNNKKTTTTTQQQLQQQTNKQNKKHPDIWITLVTNYILNHVMTSPTNGENIFTLINKIQK